MQDDFPRRAPNLTQACVVMFGVNVFLALVAIWAIWGMLMAVLFSVAMNHALSRLEVWRDARRAASIRRGKSA